MIPGSTSEGIRVGESRGREALEGVVKEQSFSRAMGAPSCEDLHSTAEDRELACLPMHTCSSMSFHIKLSTVTAGVIGKWTEGTWMGNNVCHTISQGCYKDDMNLCFQGTWGKNAWSSGNAI